MVFLMQRQIHLVLLGGFFASLWQFAVSPVAHAIKPEDPMVQQMVARGIQFLESAEIHDEGEQVLAAYTMMKAAPDPTNPVVQRGLAEAKKFVSVFSRQQEFKSNYHAAVSALLFAEVDPQQYRNELATILRYFDEVQEADGSYTYPQEKKGDTSQTQYVVLALWTLDRLGYKVDYNRLQKSMDWFFRVQDIRGAWPYQGVVPSGGGLTKQERITEGMSLAGGATLLIAGDTIGMWGSSKTTQDAGIIGLPKAIKLFKDDENAERRKTNARIKKDAVFNAIGRMENWLRANPTPDHVNHRYYYYTCYTTERYQSFLDIAQGVPIESEPDWYNRIVGELKRSQTPEGGWGETQHIYAPANTCFAILFLIRSTKKSLGAGASASAIGGYGFGENVSDAKMQNGQAVSPVAAQSVANMLQLLESDNADELDGKAMVDNAELPTDPVERTAQLERLERLVRGSRSWQARRVSAKMLGMSDEHRVVPALIFALSDPDHAVRAYARDGLRFISRKFEGFGMPDEPTNAEIRNAQRKWREWYKSVRPDYVFLDD
ncbi:hypothetical protein [Stieleria mannarensis]|uniref:hypothetical protein n=1 Tax=Stieleria mannarensis TaxID=2755585 RepID=UPI0016018C16|nr:hypothetical protein [Rhodopirellula sp. JC639]